MNRERFAEKLAELNLDGMILFSTPNLRYFSGFSGSESIVLACREHIVIFTDFRYTEQAEKECENVEVVEITRKTKWDAISKQIKNNQIQTLGFEENSLSVAMFDQLQEQLPVSLKKAGFLCDELRAEKSEEELKVLQKAQEITEEAYLAVLPMIREGVSEIFIAAALEAEMRKRGGKKPSFDTIVASGERGAMPHGVASEKLIQKGEMITMDFGCVYHGYCSDMTRTVALSNPSDQMRNVYDIVQQAQRQAFSAGAFGASLQDLDRVARGYITKEGFGESFGHGLSHGIGLEIHEPLCFEKPLPLHAVFSVEPGIYLNGVGGVRIENLAYMKETGIVNLNKTTTELIIL